VQIITCPGVPQTYGSYNPDPEHLPRAVWNPKPPAFSSCDEDGLSLNIMVLNRIELASPSPQASYKK